MGNLPHSRPTRWLRLAALTLASWLILGAILPVFADGIGETAEHGNFFEQLVANLFNSEGLMNTLGKPEFAVPAFIALNLIVFVETGLLVGFFLPGDSLLVIAGLICANPNCGWSLPLLLVSLSLAAIIGDSIGVRRRHQFKENPIKSIKLGQHSRRIKLERT